MKQLAFDFGPYAGINWKAIIFKIKSEKKWPWKTIAYKIGVTRDTVLTWRNGEFEPREKYRKTLLKLAGMEDRCAE